MSQTLAEKLRNKIQKDLSIFLKQKVWSPETEEGKLQRENIQKTVSKAVECFLEGNVTEIQPIIEDVKIVGSSIELKLSIPISYIEE